MTVALFTDEELRALVAPPVHRLRERFDQGLPDEPVAVVRRFQRGALRFITGFTDWCSLLDEFVTGRGLGELGTDEPACDTADIEALSAGVLSHLDAGRAAEAIAGYERLVDLLRERHARERDRVAAKLSELYRRDGIKVLEDSLRHVGERTLLRWMPKDIERDPRSRLISWANLLAGNFAVLSVTEHDDHFVLEQSPCGTCGRQIAEGRYTGPDAFAVVSEVSPVTFGRGETPIYRTHVAVMHSLLPVERIGVPWPVIQCPAGLAAAPCRVLLYKDPRNPAALDQVTGL